jgi:hypothetical protein
MVIFISDFSNCPGTTKVGLPGFLKVGFHRTLKVVPHRTPFFGMANITNILSAIRLDGYQ